MTRPGNFQTLIRLSVTTERQSRAVAGTLFGGDKPRIVEVKGIAIEAELGPHMLYITNEDKPGFIGRLGTLLGEAGINIATFHLGRSAPGADAVCLIAVDQAAERGSAEAHPRDSGCGAGGGAIVLSYRGSEAFFPLPRFEAGEGGRRSASGGGRVRAAQTRSRSHFPHPPHRSAMGPLPLPLQNAGEGHLAMSGWAVPPAA